MEAGHSNPNPDKTEGEQPQSEAVSEEHQSSNAESCVICLQPVTERAITVPCNHYTFDFICLASWLNERSTCPLCNVNVTEVQYDWRAPDDYKTYQVNPKEEVPQSSGAHRQSTVEGTRGRGRNVRSRARRGQFQQRPQLTEDEAVLRRRHVYRRNLYSLHVGSNRVSRYRNITPQVFAADAELQSRARRWIRRELQVFRYLNPTSANPAPSSRSGRSANNAEFLLEYIIAILRTVDVRDSQGRAEDMLADFLGRSDARLFLHELSAWLRSPYNNLQDWDTHVQYSEPLPGQNYSGRVEESRGEKRGVGSSRSNQG